MIEERIFEPRLERSSRATYEGTTEYLLQMEIIALVKIFGREIAQEKVANMLLIAFKETGR